MRKSIIIKTLLRAPVKTILTFLLIAVASFALFSRITDYAITTREAAKAESFYNGVAALDNTVPDMLYIEQIEGSVTYGRGYGVDNKPWPTKEELKELSSLPGVVIADTRYMTAGLVEDYKRLADEDDIRSKLGRFVLEGVYAGCENISNSQEEINLLFDHVTVLAGDIEQDPEKPIEIRTIVTDTGYKKGYDAYSREFFEKLEKGSKCLVIGDYNEVNGRELEFRQEKEEFHVLDGLLDDYLETEEFAYQKGLIEAFNQGLSTYDIVYTKDTRAIPYFNEREMVIVQGRPLIEEDTDSCVVSERFLKTYGLSIGDRVNIQLGDQLFHQNSLGAQARDADTISNFNAAADLEIVGAYRFVNTSESRFTEMEWNYTINTIFVPSELLAAEIPEDYETAAGEFSIFVEDANKIQAFREAVEPLAAELGLGLRFSDGGWMSIKDSFQTGKLTSLLTTLLYVIGSLLALLLAVYLYIGRNKKSYAILRTLGVPGKKAGNTIVLPLCMISALAIPAGGFIGLFYASVTAAKVLEDIANRAPGHYVYILEATFPVVVIILCLLFELAFIATITLFFLNKMKKIAPLELLQEDGLRAKANKNAVFDQIESSSNPVRLNMIKISVVDEKPEGRKYGALQQVSSYILRHMRRGMGKTAVSLILAAVLTAGVGMFVLARLTYQDIYTKVEIKGRAMDFSYSSIVELSKLTNLIDDFYCYGNFSVRVNNLELHTNLTITNNLERYLSDNDQIAYAEGYDSSALDSTGQVCLLGQELAKDLNISPGDEIALMSDTFYSVLKKRFENEEELAAAAEQDAQLYKVVGVVQSKDTNVNANIFTGINNDTQSVYGQDYPISYSEFKMADNERIDYMNKILEEQKKQGNQYAPMASYHIDAEAFENIKRVRNLLESLFPIAVAAAVLIGVFSPGLVILQSAKEAAFLRILGVTKKRARCMLVSEQIILCIAGIVLVAGGMALYNSGLFARGVQTLAACWALYLLGCICGASIAAVQVTRHRVLELLQVKE